jgi:hypothetical protein
VAKKGRSVFFLPRSLPWLHIGQTAEEKVFQAEKTVLIFPDKQKTDSQCRRNQRRSCCVLRMRDKEKQEVLHGNPKDNTRKSRQVQLESEKADAN